MLSPNDRALLPESVRPPAGYRLDHALITTYSLNLTAALSVPLALTFHDWEESDDGKPHVDPVGLLEALRSNAKRLTILCQAGEIAVPPPQRNVFAFLEPAVVPVTAPLGGVFHPKAWILRYLPDDPDTESVRYRLLCASRNLTFDRSWDILLELDGRLGEAEDEDRAPAGEPLAQFVTGLRAMAAASIIPLSDEREAALARIEAEIADVRFDPPDKTQEVRFHPLGIEEGGADPFEGRRDRMLVISPFLGAGCLERLASGERSVVVSTQVELDAVGPETLERFDQVKVLTDLVDHEPLDPDESTAGPPDASASLRLGDSADGLLRGLHAKVYVADAGWRGRVWVGSANATGAAFSTNVELLVELEGKKGRCGVDAILGDDEGGLRSLLEPYRRSEDADQEHDEREAERLADSAAHALGAARLELHVLRAENGAAPTRLALELRAPEGLPKELAAIEAKVWPITMSDDRARPLEDESFEECRWEPLETEQVTAFLGVAITARVGDAEIERRVTMRALLHGLPADRDGAIIRSILSSPERLLRYLAFLLADLGDPASAVGMMGLLGTEPGANEPGDAAPASLELPLLESMVRALARDPQRIDRVEELVREISASEHTRAFLPEDFERIFDPIRIARERLGDTR